jgi:hypothetical protein
VTAVSTEICIGSCVTEERRHSDLANRNTMHQGVMENQQYGHTKTLSPTFCFFFRLF